MNLDLIVQGGRIATPEGCRRADLGITYGVGPVVDASGGANVG